MVTDVLAMYQDAGISCQRKEKMKEKEPVERREVGDESKRRAPINEDVNKNASVRRRYILLNLVKERAYISWGLTPTD